MSSQTLTVDEFVGYSDSSTGFLIPLIAIRCSDGATSFRDMTREDVSLIDDPYATPGGWLFKRNSPTGNNINTVSWARRFAILRGSFLFYFRSPQNERPIGVVPLANCEIVVPGKTQKSFVDKNASRSLNEKDSGGFEFEIRPFVVEGGVNGAPVRLYVQSLEERDLWIQACANRVDAAEEPINLSLPGMGSGSNVCITQTMLNKSGVSPSPPTSPVGASNPLLPPSIYSYQAGEDMSVLSRPTAPQDNYSYQDGSTFDDNESISSYSTTASRSRTTQQSSLPPPPPPQAEPRRTSVKAKSKVTPSTVTTKPFSERAAENKTSLTVEELQMQQSTEESSDVVVAPDKHSNIVQSRNLLERSLQGKLHSQQEASDRETQAREKFSSVENVEKSKLLEQKNPLNLATVFRTLLFFVNEELVEDPFDESPGQMPHMRGQYTEDVLTSVYRRYCCKTTGYMSLEEWVEFLDDCAVMQTHVPRDDMDEPEAIYRDLLDPVRLLSLIPRTHVAAAGAANSSNQGGGYGGASQYLHAAAIGVDNSEFEANLQSHQRRMQNDAFSITFTQFYQLLIHVAEVVYPELCDSKLEKEVSLEELKRGRTIALNKFILESIIPLYCWCIPTIPPPSPESASSQQQEAIYLHEKKGCVDGLLLDSRISLLLITFAPNLWKTFLLYAQDINAKVPELQLPYPQCAQNLEKALFGVPTGCPYRADTKAAGSTPENDCIIITEASATRMCLDYGLIPHVLSRQELKDLYKDFLGRQTHTTALGALTRCKQKTANAGTLSSQKTARPGASGMVSPQKSSSANADKHLRFGGKASQKIPSVTHNYHQNVPKHRAPLTSLRATGTAKISTNVNPPAVGLAFSEFIELISRMALNGMSVNPNFQDLYPTDFSKVLSILTTWGLADVRVLEEARAIISSKDVLF